MAITEIYGEDGVPRALTTADLAGGGGGGGAGTPVMDNAGVRWLWVYDKDAGTSTYISLATGNSGTPTFPLSPDSDASVEVSNFPATQQVVGPLTNTELRSASVIVENAWQDGAYTLNASGQLISETQVNTVSAATRTRVWTYATQPNGDVVATPGEWA